MQLASFSFCSLKAALQTDNSVHILFLTENFPPETNAAATRVYERACYWVKWGHEVTIITSAPNFPEGRLFEGYCNSWRQVESVDGLRIVRVKTYIAANQGIFRRTLDFVSFMFSAFVAGLFEKRLDVIVATSPQFFAAVGGWALSAVRRVPFVFELGDLWPASIVAVNAMRDSNIIRMLEKLELFLYRRSDSIIALTKAFKNNLVSRGINGRKVTVILNGVDLWRYAPSEPDLNMAARWNIGDRFIAGYIGTHGMAHGLSNVLESAQMLSDRSDIGFLFAGAGAERAYLIEKAKNSGLNNVIFVDPQPKENVPAIWSLCNVALISLKNNIVFADVIPSKMFEAMAMGLPIIAASPEGEASRILYKEKAGLHVKPEDPKALADAIRLFRDDHALWQKTAAFSLSAAPNYSREYQARKMIIQLEVVVKKSNQKQARYE